jgi:hypothetical protein
MSEPVWLVKDGTLEKVISTFKNADQDEKNEALLTAITYGHAGPVSLLLDHGADIHTYNALVWAIYYGYTEIVKLLLDRGAKVCFPGNTEVIIYATEKYHEEILLHLLSQGSNITHIVNKTSCIEKRTCQKRAALSYEML